MPALMVLLVLLSCGPAFAHGAELDGQTFAWSLDPWIVVPIAFIGILYAIGYCRLRNQARNSVRSHDRSALLYFGGWLSLALTLMSPLHEMGEASFTAHMVEHEIIMAVAAPVLVLARPAGALMWGLPRILSKLLAKAFKLRPANWMWTFVSAGATATVLHGAAIWGWHAPALFDAAIETPLLHRLQHLSFFLTALLFWRAIFWRCAPGLAAWHLFLTMLHTSLLGALIALAPGILYEAQTRDAFRFGMTALEDQQLAGILMWIPAGAVYAGFALFMLARCVGRSAEGGIHGRQ